MFEDPRGDGLVQSTRPVVEGLVGDKVVVVFPPGSGVRCGLALGRHEGLGLVVLRTQLIGGNLGLGLRFPPRRLGRVLV